MPVLNQLGGAPLQLGLVAAPNAQMLDTGRPYARSILSNLLTLSNAVLEDQYSSLIRSFDLERSNMWISNPLCRVLSIRSFLIVVTIVLVLVNGYVANAQDNTNNSNSANANTAGNANTNANTNSNTNTNTNNNQNRNANSKSDTGLSRLDEITEARRNDLTQRAWFPFVVTAMFGLVLIPFAWTIVRAIRFSKSTFRSPLGLPEGSLRAMLAFTLVAFLGFYVLASILSMSELKPPDFLLGIVATVIGFYFGSRTGETGSSAARNGSVEGSVVDKNGSPAAGASVELFQSGVKKFTRTADTNGRYRFDSVPVGNYEAQASLSGHTPSDPKKVTVTAGDPQTVDLKLK